MRAGGLLANNVDCQYCQQPMELVDRPDDQEKFSWRCSNGRCARKHSRMSVKTGSIFEETKVPLAKWLHVVVLWTIETSVTNTCALTNLSMHTVIDLFQFLRDICGGKLLQNPVQLGGIDATGAGIICEIDESCFRHKTKYHRGRAPQRESVGFLNSRYQHYPSNGIFTNGQQTSLIYIGKVFDMTGRSLILTVNTISCDLPLELGSVHSCQIAKYWSFQYCVFYNTSITSIAG